MAELAENDTLKTIGSRGSRVWLYPAWFRGTWMTRRTAVHAALVILLLLGPWIDVGGHPAMHFDIQSRRAYFWGLQLFATDGYYILFLFGAVALSVFLVTALFGRAWCGWACPQTVFLESLIRPLERLIEGNHHRRRRRDESGWTVDKVIRKAIKQALFLTVAGAIGTTFVAYFLGRDGVWEAQFAPSSHPVGTFTFVLITGLVYFDFAWFREQTCLVVCPYGRFQSVLLDPHSLTVAYDERRGEPRGKKREQTSGDCIDCNRCVQVCPTGADIRKGTQMECVQCLACIDACDDVMLKLKRPTGLVRLTSEAALDGQAPKIARPRVIAYAVGLVIVLAVGLTTLARHEAVEVNLTRQAQSAVLKLPDGRVQNTMRLRISNKSDEPRAFTVTATAPGHDTALLPVSPYIVAPGEVGHMPLLLQRALRDEAMASQSTFTVIVRDDYGYETVLSPVFLLPPNKANGR